MEAIFILSPILPAFLLVFLLIYIFGYMGVFRKWGQQQRLEASSCLISLAHGSPAVLMSVHAVLVAGNPRGFASANTAYQNGVLEFSMAYFLVDLIHYLLFFPDDVLFIGHHVATLYVLGTCRYLVGHGAPAILGLLALAEATSACQNVWSLAGTTSKLHRVLSPPFYAFYTIVRGILGPLFLYEVGAFYSSGVADDVLPRWVWVSWVIVVALAILGSMSWVMNLWIELFRQRKIEVSQN